MTRLHLAAIAALCASALLVSASIGEAQGEDRYRADASCKTRHPGDRDFAKIRTEVQRQGRGGPDRRAGAAVFLPAAGVKVITKLVDLTPQNGNNVVGKAKKSDMTNADGVAKTRHEFNNFGNYRVKVKVKTGGEVVATDEIEFGVADREGGKCEAPLTGRP
jgi:hypothetical protein